MVDVTIKAHNYLRMNAELKALQEKVDALKAELIEAVKENDGKAIHINEGCKDGEFIEVKFTPYSQTRVDTNALKKDGLYAKYSKSISGNRFSCSVIGGDLNE